MSRQAPAGCVCLLCQWLYVFQTSASRSNTAEHALERCVPFTTSVSVSVPLPIYLSIYIYVYICNIVYVYIYTYIYIHRELMRVSLSLALFVRLSFSLSYLLYIYLQLKTNLRTFFVSSVWKRLFHVLFATFCCGHLPDVFLCIPHHPNVLFTCSTF